MPITLTELGPARKGTATQISRQYGVQGTTNESLLLAALLTGTPLSIGDWIRDDEGINFEEVIEDAGANGAYWLATVPFTKIEAGVPDVGEFSYSFDYAEPTGHIYQSLETLWATADAPNFDGAIQVVDDGGKQRVEGLSLGGGTETFKWAFSLPGADFHDAYQEAVEELAGTVNEDPFHGRPRGSLRLVRVSGGITNKDRATIEFGIASLRNESDDIPIGSTLEIDVSEITVGKTGGWFGTGVPDAGTKHGFKEGHQLLWTYYEHATDDTAKRLIKPPDAVYVERVYPYGDWAKLGF